jgi:hypothetical protein
MLPQCHPHDWTVHHRVQEWCEREVLRDVLTELANTQREQGEIDEYQAFIDATCTSDKGEGEAHDKTHRWIVERLFAWL